MYVKIRVDTCQNFDSCQNLLERDIFFRIFRE